MDKKAFKTIEKYCEDRFIEKKSEFIGYLTPISDENQAIGFINEIREKHRKATHNVYAYILREEGIVRYSDDGEPQGTAGVPVLEVLEKEKLTNVCCVVTRYFGGILLGGGGLVRAYSHAVKIAVDKADIMIMTFCDNISITFKYPLYGKVINFIERDRVKIVSQDFSDIVRMELLIDNEITENMKAEIINCCNGKVDIQYIQSFYYNMT